MPKGGVFIARIKGISYETAQRSNVLKTNLLFFFFLNPFPYTLGYRTLCSTKHVCRSTIIWLCCNDLCCLLPSPMSTSGHLWHIIGLRRGLGVKLFIQGEERTGMMVGPCICWVACYSHLKDPSLCLLFQCA